MQSMQIPLAFSLSKLQNDSFHENIWNMSLLLQYRKRILHMATVI